MKARLWILAVVALAATLGIAVTPSENVEAQMTCFDSYVLLSGSCPDPCSHGDDCPCTTCYSDKLKPGG